MRRSLLALVAALLAAAPAPAADRIHVVTVAGRNGGEVLIPRFDPELGQLQSVRVTLQLGVQGALGFENLSAGPSFVSASFGAYARILAPGGATLVEALTTPIECNHLLAPFDGTVDLAGPSGVSFPDLASNATVLRTLHADPFWVAGLAAAEGPIALIAEVIDTTQVTGSSRLAVRRGQVATAVVTVDYQYTPYED